MKKQKKKKKRSLLLKLLLVLEVLILIGFIAFAVMVKYISSINTTSLDTSSLYTVHKDTNMENYTNIALFGIDTRSEDLDSEPSRSDAIIICSINNDTKEVALTSIYRDSYVSIDRTHDDRFGDVFYTKLTHAYAYGGPELAISTINRNYDLDITQYATVNFKIMANIIDAIGGVQLEVEDDFIDDLNKYIKSVNHYNGGNSPLFDSAGTYTFDGNQAVAYARIRHNQNGDISRANRQRIVLQAILAQAKSHPIDFLKAINQVLPQIQTNIESNDLIKMVLNGPKYEISNQQGFPYSHEEVRLSDGIYYDIPTTLESNVKELHKNLFGTEDYELDDQSSRISQKIIDQTGYQ